MSLSCSMETLPSSLRLETPGRSTSPSHWFTRSSPSRIHPRKRLQLVKISPLTRPLQRRKIPTQEMEQMLEVLVRQVDPRLFQHQPSAKSEAAGERSHPKRNRGRNLLSYFARTSFLLIWIPNIRFFCYGKARRYALGVFGVSSFGLFGMPGKIQPFQT